MVEELEAEIWSTWRAMQNYRMQVRYGGMMADWYRQRADECKQRLLNLRRPARSRRG